jgi:trans-aconitate 2-methyltransferase
LKYTFGTSEKAIERLEEIAKFFNPLAHELIVKYLAKKPKIAVDLGCGPGFTTEMLATATNPSNAIGMDNSKDMLSFAKKRFPQYQFIKQDITRIPFQIKPDIMYCRFLLSHLMEPESVINKWLTQLTENGILIVEELENIQTKNKVFNTYIETNDKLVQSQGASLHVGKSISKGLYNVKVLHNDCHKLPVNDSQAATWFYPNTISIWKNNEVISKILNNDQITNISNELHEIMNSNSKVSNITWHMRRMVLCKL